MELVRIHYHGYEATYTVLPDTTIHELTHTITNEIGLDQTRTYRLLLDGILIDPLIRFDDQALLHHLQQNNHHLTLVPAA